MKLQSTTFGALAVVACICFLLALSLQKAYETRKQWRDVLTAVRNREFQYASATLSTIPSDDAGIVAHRMRLDVIVDSIISENDASLLLELLTNQVVDSQMTDTKCQMSVELLIAIMHRFPQLKEASPEYFESKFSPVKRARGYTAAYSACDRIIYHSHKIRTEANGVVPPG